MSHDNPTPPATAAATPTPANPAHVEQGRRTFVPQVDIIEVPDGIVLYADLPGLAEEHLDVTVERNLLTIRGRVSEIVPEGYEPVHQEYGVGDYERAFTLSNEVDHDGISASLVNGVLRLHLPKNQQPAPRRIVVSAAAETPTTSGA
jgi:HSP20 family protein